jgi:membrane-associated protease RseP (regulator of RpoE activity)
MKQDLTRRWSLLASGAMLLATTITALGDEPTTTPASPGEASVAVVIQEKETPVTPETATITLDVDVVKPGEYWLGVICSPLEDELLMAHLGIEHGILIKEVVDDSPAAKAGLQKQDILIQAGDQPLTDLKTLVDKTEQAQANALTLTLIRKGQRHTVEVTPVKRPAEPPKSSATPDKEVADEWNRLQESLRLHWAPQIIERQESLPDGTKMLFVMPGFVLPDQAKDFPKNLEVTITKKGEDPAKITVKRGDDQWEIDANSLDKLPEDIRPYVKKMLGGGLSVTVGGDQFNWSANLPKPLVVPKLTHEMLKKSFKVAPNLRVELRGLAEKIPAEVREKIDAQLKDAQQKLEEVQSGIPTETLDKIQQELKELREQIEKLRAERAEKAPQRAEADKTEADKE